MLVSLDGLATASPSKPTLENIARTIGLVCPPEIRSTTAERFVDVIRSGPPSYVLALLCVGELGTTVDLGAVDGLKDLLLTCMENIVEDTWCALSPTPSTHYSYAVTYEL
jgi:hypothetical protein